MLELHYGWWTKELIISLVRRLDPNTYCESLTIITSPMTVSVLLVSVEKWTDSSSGPSNHWPGHDDIPCGSRKVFFKKEQQRENSLDLVFLMCWRSSFEDFLTNTNRFCSQTEELLWTHGTKKREEPDCSLVSRPWQSPGWQDGNRKHPPSQTLLYIYHSAPLGTA